MMITKKKIATITLVGIDSLLPGHFRRQFYIFHTDSSKKKKCRGLIFGALLND